MSNAVKIYDTTLRDGTQGEGISFSVTDKLLIAQKLDQFGVDYIEGGFPGSNPRDISFFAEAKKLKLTHAKLAAFGSTRRAGVKPEDDVQLRTLLESEMPVLTIVGKTWLLHVTEILRTTAEENLAMIEDSVRYLVSQGREVIYDAEHFFDGYLDNPDYALRTLEAAARGGATNLSCVHPEPQGRHPLAAPPARLLASRRPHPRARDWRHHRHLQRRLRRAAAAAALP